MFFGVSVEVCWRLRNGVDIEARFLEFSVHRDM